MAIVTNTYDGLGRKIISKCRELFGSSANINCPENYWNPVCQQHLNGAQDMVCVTLAASEPNPYSPKGSLVSEAKSLNFNYHEVRYV